MRYSRDGKWTPVPVDKRVAAAGWGLLVPPVFMGISSALGGLGTWLFYLVFPSHKAHAWSLASWGDWYFLTAWVSLLVVLEMKVLNGDTYSLDDMVMIRLDDLEANARRTDNILP